jgi:trans-aconitate methyltransferase
MDQQKVEALAGSPIVLNMPNVIEALRAVPGLSERLAHGVYVADVGCGGGASTVTMAAAFPRSRFLGIDPDPASVERARRLRAERRLSNVYWLAAAAHQLAPVPTHDLICAFDGIHDIVGPRAALHAIHAALADDGVHLWSLADHDEDLRTPTAERGVRELAKEAGFSRVDKLPIDDAFNRFFALRK